MKFTENIKRIFKRKLKIKTLPNNEVAIEAFTHDGKRYYHFPDNAKAATGRAICAMAIYEELKMRCTSEYLQKHVKATELLLNPAPGEKIKLTELARINNNLKERLNLAPYPDHIYKLASVIFFDDSESPFSYDFDYNQKKIARWKKDPELLDFFLTMQFQDLIPFSSMSKERVRNYFQITGMMDQIHQQNLHDIIYKKG